MYGITNAGGGSGTKSTLIISIDSGSTVAVYSNSTYTTLIKTATEKSAGQFWVKGLDNGTYYIKATKGSDEATKAFTIVEYGVYRIPMAYFEATITATFPTSSTSVTLTNGSDSYSVPSASIANGTYTFIVESAGTYTGEAICNGYTMKADSVVISSTGDSATTKYKLWLYDGSLGESGATGANVCLSVSGGYKINNSGSAAGQTAGITYNTSYMVFRPYSDGHMWAINQIDISGFTTLYAHMKRNDAQAVTCEFGVTSTVSSYGSFDASTALPANNTTAQDYSCNVYSVMGDKYVKIHASNITYSYNIYGIWFE